MSSEGSDFIRKYWVQILFGATFLFSLGGVWSEFERMKAENKATLEKLNDYNETLHRRITNTNSDLNTLEKEVFQIKEDVSYTKGFVDAQ